MVNPINNTLNFRTSEIIKCTQNPIYYILNYVYIPETGGQLKYDDKLLHYKHRRVIKSLYKYKKAVFMASRQLGKALDINTDIPMHDGTIKKLNDIKVGDLILDENNNPTTVINMTPVVYERPCYKLIFNNNEEIIADENHLWKITNKIFGSSIKNTKFIFNMSKIFKNKFKFYVSTDVFIKSIEKTQSKPVKCIQVSNKDGMFLCTKSKIPTHNSTIAACMISWAMVFYPNNKAVILNMKQNAALNNLNTIKFIIDKLPRWMVSQKPFKSKSDIKTYFELFNGSRVDTFYPSTIHSSSTLARSLTVPILYIDESAFIRDMKEIYGSAQQTLSKARQQAIKNKYPYYIFITSTPNGIEGPGEWFYNRWYNSVDDDLVFDYNKDTNIDDWRKNVDIDKIVMDPNKNTFIKIQYHWSEDPTKNEHWYQEQCQELSDQRKINQELDLMFVGSTNCIFDDDTLSKFKEEEPKQIIQTPNGAQLKIFTDNIDPSDYFIIGCDTAESLTGAYCALQIFSFRNFVQVAELTHKYGSFTAYGQDIDFTFRWLYKNTKRIILNIENNTIGKATLEHLLFHIEDFDYRPFLYRDDIGKHSDQYGTKTTGLTKPLMVGCLIEFLNDNPEIQKIKSKELISQFGTIERTNSGTIRSTGYSDLFMATCFCAYLRKKKALEILPMVQNNPEDYERKLVNEFKQIINLSNPKIDHSKKISSSLEDALIGYMYENDDIDDNNNDDTFGFFG